MKEIEGETVTKNTEERIICERVGEREKKNTNCNFCWVFLFCFLYVLLSAFYFSAELSRIAGSPCFQTFC